MKGPRGMIAEAIADALAEFFVVDQAAMETRLLLDAQIVLHDTKLKPQTLELVEQGLTATIDGVVGAVAFEWQWGYDAKHGGGSDWVRNAKLTLGGLKFTAVLSETDSNAVHLWKDESPEKEEEKEEKAVQGIMGYVLDQVERIIDTLTLSVTDFEVTLELPDGGESLIMGGTNLELTSMDYIVGEPIKQHITIGSIFANVRIDEDSVYPLMDPVSYKASCVRIFGKRFLGEIDNGLWVTGESNDEGVVFHLGAEQIQLVNSLIGLLLREAPQKGTAVPSEPAGDHSKNQNSEDSAENADDGISSESQSSFFQLPLSAVSLVFTNNTKISLSGLVVKYQMDGSVLTVEGRDGFLVNDFPFFKLGETSLWCVDVVHSTIRLLDDAIDSLNDDKMDATVAFIHARDAERESLKEGIDQVMDIFQDLNNEATATMPSSQNALAGETQPPPLAPTLWSFELLGRLGCLWEGENDDIEAEFMIRGIQASVEDLSAQIDAIEQLYVPGIIKLTEPIENMTMSFDGTVLHINVRDVVATLEEPMPPKDEKIPPTSGSNTHGASGLPYVILRSTSTIDSDGSKDEPFILPFRLKVSISSFVIFDAEGEPNHTTAKKLLLALGPHSTHEKESERLGGIRTALTAESIENEMINLEEICLSGLVYLEAMDFLPLFKFNAKHVAVAAGYTAFDWKHLFDIDTHKKRRLKRQSKQKRKQKSVMPISMPFAQVQPLHIQIVVSSDLVGFNESMMDIGAFQGNAETTSADLISFYASQVISKVPNIITNVNVLGADVKESVVTQLGSAIGATTLGSLGAAAGSVGGVLSLAAFDGVQGTIKAGKKSRGAESDDTFQASDITRGLREVASDATRDGAKWRGKTDEQNRNSLDWAVGATTDVVNYTNDNKSRLGGAGAGAVGFAYGMLFGGPIGAIAGGLVASVATTKTIDVVTEKVAKNNEDSQVKAVEGKNN